MTDYTYNTGNTIGSTDVRDGVDNLKSFDVLLNSTDDTYQDRLGSTVPTAAGAIKRLGPVVTAWTFTTGGTLNYPNEAALNPGDGNYYGWTGSFPHVVAPSTDPTLPGSGYVPRTDVVLRDQITNTGELPLKGDGYKSTNHYGGVIVGDNPLGGVGDDWPDAVSLRDAVNVSRKILNEPTDCHAFADKTVIDSPSDYGGYGSFDATTIVRGAHTQDHVASFQARTQYNGTGRIKNLWGMICWPTASSTGTVENYTAINLVGVATSTATVENATFIDILPQPVTGANVGVLVRNSSAPTSISFNSSQDSAGYSWYAGGGGVMYQKGKACFGFDGKTNPLAIYKINASDDTGTTVAGIGADSGNGGYSAVGGDNQYSIFTNGAPRLTVLKSNNSYSTIPGLSDGTAYLGTVSNRWAAVYAVNGTIQTSDAREKTAPARIDDAVLDAWGDVQLIAFKWLSSVAQKGDLARWHFGVIAQQVRDAFIARGLDGTKYGLLCYDEWCGQDEEVCENGIVKPAVEAGNRWGIRADQCLFLEAAYQRRRSDRIEARLLAIESK